LLGPRSQAAVVDNGSKFRKQTMMVDLAPVGGEALQGWWGAGSQRNCVMVGCGSRPTLTGGNSISDDTDSTVSVGCRLGSGSGSGKLYKVLGKSLVLLGGVRHDRGGLAAVASA
jgi:hypothetical protein